VVAPSDALHLCPQGPRVGTPQDVAVLARGCPLVLQGVSRPSKAWGERRP